MDSWKKWSDLQKTHSSARTEEWQSKAMRVLPRLKYDLVFKEAKAGPDGWPYLWVMPVEGSEGESLSQITKWLESRGIGLVLVPEPQAEPDFVFTYGMVWNCIETGKFHVEGGSDSGDFSFKDGQTAWVGSPSQDYLPSYVRGIIKKFFLDQGVVHPKILMVSQDQVQFDLAFSIESLGNPDKSEWQGVLEAISWFLPSHYSVALLSEKVFVQFEEL